MKPVLEALRRAYGGPATLDEPRPLEQVILLLLSRKSDIRRSQAAMKQIQDHYVDWNEVRVTSAYELRKSLKGLGEPKPGDKADQLKELLSTVYNRFNKLDLDFLRRESQDPEAARKRERFMAWLQEKAPAIAATMALYGAPKNEVVATPALPRLLVRLGWLNGKSAGLGACRECVLKHVPEDLLVAAQWSFYHLLEENCHSRNPDCVPCPLVRYCPTGKEEVKAQEGALARAKKEAAGRALKARAGK
jgi:endonuclease III